MKAGLIIGLAVIALVAINVSMWRRMKSMIAERRGWTRADFVGSLEAAGCPGPVIAVVLDTIEPFYHAEIAPQMDDEIKRFLGADEDEVEDWTARRLGALSQTALRRLGLVVDGQLTILNPFR